MFDAVSKIIILFPLFEICIMLTLKVQNNEKELRTLSVFSSVANVKLKGIMGGNLGNSIWHLAWRTSWREHPF